MRCLLLPYCISCIEVDTGWVAYTAGDISARDSLYGKGTCTAISRYVSTSDSGVVGGSGAAATV